MVKRQKHFIQGSCYRADAPGCCGNQQPRDLWFINLIGSLLKSDKGREAEEAVIP